jgi:hypothetical protein
MLSDQNLITKDKDNQIKQYIDLILVNLPF